MCQNQIKDKKVHLESKNLLEGIPRWNLNVIYEMYQEKVVK